MCGTVLNDIYRAIAAVERTMSFLLQSWMNELTALLWLSCHHIKKYHKPS